MEIDMDLEQQLSIEHSKNNSLLIRDYIGDDPERFGELIDLMESKKQKIAQRSGMALSACFDRNPNLIQPQLKRLINRLEEKDLQLAIKRNIVRILQFVKVPESQQSQLFDFGLATIADPKESIAVKAFTMKILVNLCKEHPDLRHEVIPLFEEELIRNREKGVQARGRAMLKLLYKIND